MIPQLAQMLRLARDACGRTTMARWMTPPPT
jgi:hypothetical protein